MGRTVRARQLRTSQQECAATWRLEWRTRWSPIRSRARRSTTPSNTRSTPICGRRSSGNPAPSSWRAAASSRSSRGRRSSTASSSSSSRASSARSPATTRPSTRQLRRIPRRTEPASSSSSSSSRFRDCLRSIPRPARKPEQEIFPSGVERPVDPPLYFEQASIFAAVVCSLIVVGLLKGIIGVGMPVVALPLLSLFIDIKSAAMLLSMPLIFSNLPQALEGGKTRRCLIQLMPVILGMIPGLFLGVRVLLALDPSVAKIIAGLVIMGVGGVTLLAPKLQLQSRLVLPTGITFGFFGGILGGIAAMPGPLVFIFLLAKGLRGKPFTKEASLYLVVSAGLLAILLTASRQFSWLDVSVSTAAMLPVVLGMYVGQHMRDKIAPETFKKLVLIAVVAAGAELLRHGFFS